MRFNLNLIAQLAISIFIISCGTSKNSKSDMVVEAVMEVTTFKISSDVNPATFNALDKQVENNFTSKQTGFIKRQSGVDNEGNYVVVVYWKTVADAEASMNKFMEDKGVAEYAQLIDGPTMTMSRYIIDKPLNTDRSQFVEIMTFDVQPGTDMVKFDAINKKVETDFTRKREGFIQRLTGVNEAGKQIIAVYWSSKEASDIALQPFMDAPIASKFMSKMDQSSIVMGRYKILN